MFIKFGALFSNFFSLVFDIEFEFLDIGRRKSMKRSLNFTLLGL